MVQFVGYGLGAYTLFGVKRLVDSALMGVQSLATKATEGIKEFMEGLTDLAVKVSGMSPEALVNCAAVCAEMLHHSNLTDAHAKLSTWKAILRADAKATHEGASLPTFQAAFDKLVAKGVGKARWLGTLRGRE